VGGYRVAWKRCAIDDEDAVTLAGKKHSGWRTGTAGSHDDEVEWLAHWSSDEMEIETKDIRSLTPSRRKYLKELEH
jgi:hypothetical protein